MLIANNLSFKRLEKWIFQKLDISLSPGKIIHVRGRNGIGKTTLIKILSCILKPTTGEIYWNGKNTNKNREEFFKNLSLIMDINTSKKDLTVFENIYFWKNLFLSNISQNEIESLLFNVDLLQYKQTFVKNLSYGEKRKLEVIRLILEKKKLWILDEPYLGLDEETINIFNETIINHTQNQGMVIFSSHYRLETRGVDTIDLKDYANN